ncbi:vWA domain-containing protein [Oligoflexus tunisiensis]|uniref:vWA domain-containing protein n=1 Tax=Oligoflexus tunisiensis TaxID=708132 RepID=UPI00114C8B61|nr:vWA domain-containing protein [Oligoflexus tunisiensis]
MQQTPVFDADVSVSPLESQETSLPTPVAMNPDTLEGRYPAAQVLTDQLRFTIDTQVVTTEFELKDIHKEQREVFRQVARESRMETFQQGHPPKGKQDVFDQQAQKGPVDILLVIDNSISMTEEQINLSDKMHDLVASLGNSDWQIGVISTTAVFENGEPQCLMNVIRSTEPDAAAKFRTAVLAGTTGDSNEQGILQAVVGLSCPSRPWLRSQTPVAVLIVSDEDNCSADGVDCRGSVAENENYLIQFVEQTLGREIGKNAGFYGIFSPPADPCQTSPNVGLQYQRLVDYKAQGMVNYGNICDASYKTTLNRISDNIAVLLGSQFELKETPLPDSLKLKLVLSGGTEKILEPHEFSLNQRTILFAPGHEPPASAHLVADYLVAGQPLWKKLTLAEKPGQDTLEVRINDELLEKHQYQWNDRNLEFADFPPANAVVRINYALDKPLNKKFSLSSPALADSLQVAINGQPTQAWHVDARGLEIVFDPAPAYGSEIALTWTSRVGPQLTYALPVATESSGHKIWDGTWSVPFAENEGLFTIPAAVHRPGKTLTLQYEMPDARTRTFPLAHKPIPRSAQLEQGDHSCQFGAGLELMDDQLISTCGVRSRTEFVVTYQYYEPQSEFTLPGVENPEIGHWKVYVNGVETDDYVRKGSTFTFPVPVAPDALIGLQYTLPGTGSISPSL